MELAKKTRYVNGNGQAVSIMGACTFFPQFYWSLEGGWYEQSTGLAVDYVAPGQYVVSESPGRALVEAIGPVRLWSEKT